MTEDYRYDAEDAAELEDDGVLDSADSLSGGLDDDAVEQAIDPPERWSAGEGYGTTLAEERAGESLDRRLAEEEPEIDPYRSRSAADAGESPEAGTLLADDDGSRGDDEPEILAREVARSGTRSAEEGAMHLIDEADPGSADPLGS